MAMIIEVYLKENVDDNVTIKSWREKSMFPVFLRSNYNFYEMMILGTLCILLEITDETPGIDTLQKHIKRIEALIDYQIVIFYKEISRYRRKTFIENRIPFVGLDLKKATQNIEKEVKCFSTSVQFAYLYFLYHKDEIVNMTEFAK